MVTKDEIKSVFQDSHQVSFRIQKCDLSITIDPDFQNGTYVMDFYLIKIAEGNDTWTVTSHFSEDDFELISIKSEGNGNLKAIPIEREDSKACHLIYLDKIPLNNSRPYHFTVTYKERMATTKMSEGYFLFKRHFISLVKIFPNYCNSFNVNVSFLKKRIKILAANPNDSIKEEKLVLLKNHVSPYEHTTLSFITVSGLIIHKHSMIFEKLFWSSGIIAWIIKLILDNLKNGNN